MRHGVRAWGAALLALIVTVGTPALWRAGAWHKEPFDEGPLVRLRAQRPQYVFLGNSMLYTRVDPARLAALLGGRESWLFAEGGSGSALWYLQLKNYVAASGIRPRRVFVFFRDLELTDPTDGTDGDSRRPIERASHDAEPVYARVMAANRSVGDHLRSVVDRMYPLRRYREGVEQRVHRASVAPLLGRAETASAALDEINGLFALERLRPRPRAATIAIRRLYDFDARVTSSFLDPMLDVAREHALAVTFVRVQRRPGPDGLPLQAPDLVRYVARLRASLEGRGAGFHDFTGDPEIPLAVYGEGDHIAPQHLAAHTALVARRLSMLQ